MFFDLHIHSEYSYDSLSKVEDILRVAKRRGLSGIAITDHEEFEGCLEAAKKTSTFDLFVINGVEVATEHGDVIGLFLRERVTSHVFLDVVAEIKEQDGLVVLPHPFKRANIIPEVVLNHIDAIEIYNARGERVGYDNCNQMAYDLAMTRDTALTAGSDAHFLFEIGRGGVVIGNVSRPEEVKEALISKQVKQVVRKGSPLYLEVLSQFIKAYKCSDVELYKLALKRLVKTFKWEVFGKKLSMPRPKGRSV